MNKIFFIITQFIFLCGNTKQSYVRQAAATVKAIGKTIKSPLFKPIGNTIKNSVDMIRHNKNIIKNSAFSLQEKYLKTRHNFQGKPVKYLGEEMINQFKHMKHCAGRGASHLDGALGKKKIQMRSTAQSSGKGLGSMVKRSAEQIRGEKLSSLINMVSKSKPQLPFLAGGSLIRLTGFSLVPPDDNIDLKVEEEKNIEKVEQNKEQSKEVLGEAVVKTQESEKKDMWNSFNPVKKAPHPMKVGVTGGYSYSGQYITKLLMEDPNITEIRNFTNHPHRRFFKKGTNPRITEHSLNVSYMSQMKTAFDGCDVVFQNYWQRFVDKNLEESPALRNIKRIVDACAEVGVKRIVYVSHTQPSVDSKIPYIRSKALAEEYIKKEMPSYAFLRPNCIFGDTPGESTLINNTCHLLNFAPLMLFPYAAKKAHIQPVHVRDLAEMAVNLGFDDGPDKNRIVDAVGPEKLKFFDFMNMLKEVKNSKTRIHTNILLNTFSVYQLTKLVNLYMGDTFIGEDELDILCEGLSCSAMTPEEAEAKNLWGKRSVTEWAKMHKKELGANFVNTFDKLHNLEG